MTTDKKPKRVVMSNVQVIQAAQLLDKHLYRLGDTAEPSDFWRYAEGWDDSRVATEVSNAFPNAPRLNTAHIQRLRVDLGRELAPPRTTNAVTYRDSRISLLIERFNELLELVEPGVVGGGLADMARLKALRISADDLRQTGGAS